MNRMVLTARVGGDGSLHLNLPIGLEQAGVEMQVTVEPLDLAGKRTLLASDLLNSGLVGMWADRIDIEDNHAFARRLREQAQTRRRDA